MAARCRVFDWATISLGPVERWSSSLRTSVGLVLACRNPMLLFWGPGLVQLYNDAFRPSLGVGGRDAFALGAPARTFWSDVWGAIGSQIERVMAGGEAAWHEDVYLPIERNGRLEDVWWTYSYSAVRDDDGTIAATLVVCQETTGRVRAERERNALLAAVDVERRRLADAFRQAPAFLAIVRGPDHVFELANESYAQLIGHRPLLGLVNDVLNYARLGSGRVEFDVQAIRVTDAVADVLPLIEPQLAAKGLAIDLRLGEPTLGSPTGDGTPFSLAAPLVWADREKLGQVLLNLLSNAVKFTPRGGRVTVELIPRGEDAADEHAYLHVGDTGIGIPVDKLDAVFEPFVQVRSDLAREAGGTGLGLAISRDLARGMGGDIRVRSAEGTGSTFAVALRRAVTPDGRPIERRAVERRVQVERRKTAPRRSGHDRRDDGDALRGATD